MEPQTPTQNFNVDDLVFKTMPKDMNAPVAMPTPVPVQPAPPAPAPIPVAPKPVTPPPAPVIPTAAPVVTPPIAPKPNLASPLASPIPTAHKPIEPIQTVKPEEPHDLATDFGSDLRQGRAPAGRNAIIIGVVVLLLAGAAYFAFAKGIIKNPFAKKPADTTTQQQTSNAPVSAIPDDWRLKYFASATCADQNVCGDASDPDKDGLTNLEEYKANTDPNSNDSDADKISDGDEVHIFGYDPTTNHTSGNMSFTDSDDAKAKWNSPKHAKFTDAELLTIAANIKTYGFHDPTIALLGPDLVNSYTNFTSSASAAPNSNTAAPPQEGALDRDTQRYNTINKISFALLKYKTANKKYPNVSNFADMITQIRPLISAQAINTVDPVNTEPYTYKYKAVNSGANFQLSYFSETTNQAIIVNEASAQQAQSSDLSIQRDTKRKTDLEQIASALELYSNDHMTPANPDQKVFPSVATWKSDLESQYISKVPVDPLTNKDYVYTVSSDFGSYALQAQLENPPTDKRGYLCTAEGCDFY